MPITTQGLISVTPIRITSSASLAEMAEVANLHHYAVPPPSSGWGNVRDGSDALIGKVQQARIKAGLAEVLPEDDRYPSQFRARFYWDEPDRAMLRALGETGNPTLINRFEATDVTVSVTGENGVYLGLVSTRNDGQLFGHVLPALRNLVEAIDSSSRIEIDDNQLAFGDSDIFRWLLARVASNPQLSPVMLLLEVRSINSQDVFHRLAMLSKGAELDRPELLALLSSTSTRFGPAKIVIYMSDLELGVDLEIHEDGGFAVFRGKSAYDDEEGLSPEDKGLILLRDVAHHVLPSLQAAYNGDNDWRQTGRQNFLQQARDDLAATLANG